MNKIKFLTLAAIGLLSSGGVYAHDFVKDGIFYNVLSQEDKTLEVTFRGSSYDSYAKEYTGVVSIPSTVNFAANEFVIKDVLSDWTSTNKEHGKSSQNDYTFVANVGDKLQFNWEVSSESGYDWLIITLDGVEIIKKSGTESGMFEKVFDADGTHTLVVKYTKDGSLSYGKDEGKVSKLNLISADTYSEGVYTVTGIDEYAFYNCSNLSSIKIPNTLTNIGDMAFYGCNGLEKVCINDLAAWCNIDFENYIDSGYTFYHRDSNPLTSAGNLYLNDVLVTNLVIPNNVSEIKVAAFYGCKSITSLVIPNTVGRIDDEAFDECVNLKDVRIEDGETYLSMGMCGCSDDDWLSLFHDSYLDNLYLGRNLSYSNKFPFGSKKTNIGKYVTSLEPNVHSSLIVVDAENPVYDSRDNCNAVIETATNKLVCGGKNTIIPANVATIGSFAFYNCPDLESVVIPNSVTSIEKYAFSGCYNLISLEIPNSVTSIGESAFEGTAWYNNQPDGVVYLDNYLLGYKGTMPSNTSIEIKEGTLLIADYAFSGCSDLTSLVIGNGVTSIGNFAFKGCYGLTSVVIPNSVVSIGDSAFMHCSRLTSVEIPNSVVSIGDSAFMYCSRLTSVEIPNSVTSIGNDAFSRCSGLTSVEIPNSVTSIGEYAFLHCSSLTSVVIPNSVTSIGRSVFFGCSGLTSVEIPNSVTSIGESAFSYCDNLNTITPLNRIPPTTSYSPFSNYDATLYVPYGAKDAYSEADNWKNFANIEELEPSIYELTDGEEYNEASVKTVNALTYTRTLPNLHWNALYVPFELPYEVIADRYDVAYINDVNGYDTDENGEIDDLAMEIIRIKGGTLKANYPYLIKAKTEADKAVSITVEDATLYAAEENAVDCSSVYQNYVVKGTYTKKTAEELAGKLAISTSGAWQPLAEGTALNPFRLYLSIENRDNSPLKVEPAALSRMRIVERGETTGIEEVVPSQQREDVIFDLNGRRVKQPVKGGVYIVNGKKRIL